MGQVKLEKEAKRKPIINNWVKFLFADILFSLGIWASSVNYAFPAAFGIIGGIGMIIAIIANFLSEDDK